MILSAIPFGSGDEHYGPCSLCHARPLAQTLTQLAGRHKRANCPLSEESARMFNKTFNEIRDGDRCAVSALAGAAVR